MRLVKQTILPAVTAACHSSWAGWPCAWEDRENALYTGSVKSAPQRRAEMEKACNGRIGGTAAGRHLFAERLCEILCTAWFILMGAFALFSRCSRTISYFCFSSWWISASGRSLFAARTGSMTVLRTDSGIGGDTGCRRVLIRAKSIFSCWFQEAVDGNMYVHSHGSDAGSESQYRTKSDDHWDPVSFL